MNPQLEKYINDKKEEMKKQRDEHLISLGLIDESKTKVERILFDDYAKAVNNYPELYDDVKYDNTLNKYYIDKEEKFPIKVTEEEYQELLKYIPKENEKTTKQKPNRVVSGKLTNLNVLFTVLAIIFLILGIILTGVGIDDLGGYYSDPTLFMLGISSVILSILIFIKRLFIKGFIVIVECAENNRCN